MNVKVIKLCPLYEICPRAQCGNCEPVYSDNVAYMWINYYPCLKKKPGQRKGHLCMMQIDLDRATLENGLEDVLKNRKKYTKYYYASEVDDYIKKLKEAIENDGRSSRES